MREIKYSNLFLRKAWFFSILALSLCFYSKPCEAAKSKELVFSYQIEKKEKVNPSYCMAIWLETLDGNYVKTLYASDWLAYGGYTVEGVCPVWVEKSIWATNADELPDAISGATPIVGAREMRFQWNKKELPAGRYIYKIEVHLAADYNEIYSGEIEFGKASSRSETKVEYFPEKHKEIAGLLSDVVVVFE
ncbi:MAG: DUF2271 domain-containing protein [Bacteroides sp.]|nr:DUF2271 domain-containing protein [Bacteroides sp.]